MSRRNRVSLPNSLYYVTSLNDSGETCFIDDRDRAKFFKYIGKYCVFLEFKVHAFCLVKHEFHLLLESGPAWPLSEFMRRLLTAFTVYYNRRYRKHGRLFDGPFHSFIVDKSQYLSQVSRYIHLLPEKGTGIDGVLQHPGSSLRYYLGGDAPFFLETGDILKKFGNNPQKYVKYVKKGFNQSSELDVREHSFIGDEEFILRIKKQSGLLEIEAEKQEKKKAMDDLWRIMAGTLLKETARFYDIHPDDIIEKRSAHGLTGKARSSLILLLRRNTEWTHAQIACFMGLKEKNGIPYHLKKFQTDQQITEAVIRIEKNIDNLK